MKKHEKLAQLLSASVDTVTASDCEGFKDFNDVLYYFQESGEIIYYTEALEYLTKNDPSLIESMEIALQYGYETKDLNSPLLATLHCQNAIRETIWNIADEIKGILEEEEA